MKSVYQQKNFVEKTAGNIPTQSFVELQHVVGEKQSFFQGRYRQMLCKATERSFNRVVQLLIKVATRISIA